MKSRATTAPELLLNESSQKVLDEDEQGGCKSLNNKHAGKMAQPTTTIFDRVQRGCGWCCGGCALVFVVGLVVTGGTLLSTLGAAVTLATSPGRVVPPEYAKVARAEASRLSNAQVTWLLGGGAALPAEKSTYDAKWAVAKYVAMLENKRSVEAKNFSAFLNAHEHFADYEAHRSRCEWHDRPLDAEKDYFAYKYYKNTEDWEKYAKVGRTSYCGGGRYDPDRVTRARLDAHRTEMTDFRYQTCDIQVTGDYRRADDERWSVVRLGPMTGRGGYDWHSFWHYDLIPEMTKALENQDTVWVTGYFSGAIDAEFFQPLNYPPIHHHHLHVLPTPFDSFINHNIMFQMHGDATWNEGEGGFDSWLNYMPENMAFPVSYSLQFDADLNDVRPADSEPMEFYVEIALRWTTEPPQKPAALLNFGAPFPSLQDGPMTHWTEHAVNYVPGQKESVLWYGGRVYNSGRLLHAIAHSHSHWFDEFYVFSGTPEDLGLNRGVYQVDYNNVLPWTPADHGLTNDDVKLRILYHAEKNPRVTLRCVVSGSLFEDQSQPDAGGGTTFDRFPSWRCLDDWIFQKGDPFTLVAFDKPMCEGCGAVKGPFQNRYGIPQHSIFRAVYVNDQNPNDVQHFFTYGHQLASDQVTAAVPRDHSFDAPPKEDPILNSPDLVLAFQAGLVSNTALTGFKKYRDAIRTLSLNVPAFHKLRRNLLLDRFCEL